MATISFGIGMWALLRPSWTPGFFGAVRGHMHHRPELGSAIGLWGVNVYCSLHFCGGPLLSHPFDTDHTSPFAILGAVRFNTAPHPSCVCVRVCLSVRVNAAHAGDRPPKSWGNARFSRCQRALEARRWPFQAGNPLVSVSVCVTHVFVPGLGAAFCWGERPVSAIKEG